MDTICINLCQARTEMWIGISTAFVKSLQWSIGSLSPWCSSSPANLIRVRPGCFNQGLTVLTSKCLSLDQLVAWMSNHRRLNPEDGTAYIICRGFCRCEFETMQGAEILRKSIMVSSRSALFGVCWIRLDQVGRLVGFKMLDQQSCPPLAEVCIAFRFPSWRWSPIVAPDRWNLCWNCSTWFHMFSTFFFWHVPLQSMFSDHWNPDLSTSLYDFYAPDLSAPLQMWRQGYELEVAALGMSPMFRKITATRETRLVGDFCARSCEWCISQHAAESILDLRMLKVSYNSFVYSTQLLYALFALLCLLMCINICMNQNIWGVDVQQQQLPYVHKICNMTKQANGPFSGFCCCFTAPRNFVPELEKCFPWWMMPLPDTRTQPASTMPPRSRNGVAHARCRLCGARFEVTWGKWCPWSLGLKALENDGSSYCSLDNSLDLQSYVGSILLGWYVILHPVGSQHGSSWIWSRALFSWFHSGALDVDNNIPRHGTSQVASRVAAKQLEATIRDMDLLELELGDALPSGLSQTGHEMHFSVHVVA